MNVADGAVDNWGGHWQKEAPELALEASADPGHAPA